MILVNTLKDDNLVDTVKHLRNLCNKKGFDFWIKDNQKKAWKCIKFYIYNPDKKLMGKICPLEVQLISNAI